MMKQLKLLVTAAVALIFSVSATAIPAQTATASTFSVAKKTGIPGETLKPGTYSIQVLDHLSDRMVVRVEGTGTKQPTVFLAVPSGSAGTSSPGPVIWQSEVNGEPIMRGFAFPSGNTIEFVYPKATAVELAKANTDQVIAIDPQSEGLPALHKMSQADMKMINLWLLSLTKVGPNDKTPAIAAERYEGRTTQQPVTAALTPAHNGSGVTNSATQVAELSMPAMRSTHTSSTPSAQRRVKIAALPHTASSLPLFVLVGMLSLLAVAAIRLRPLRM